MLSSTIKSGIKKLWDKFWSGGISNPLTAIEQISYLLFMRRLDEVDLNNIKKAEFSGEKYQSIFQGSFSVPNINEEIDKETLRKIWVLRNFLSDMTSVESMEFMRDRLLKTESNEEFLISMNSE